jgi:hypothetical protein
MIKFLTKLTPALRGRSEETETSAPADTRDTISDETFKKARASSEKKVHS